MQYSPKPNLKSINLVFLGGSCDHVLAMGTNSTESIDQPRIICLMYIALSVCVCVSHLWPIMSIITVMNDLVIIGVSLSNFNNWILIS